MCSKFIEMKNLREALSSKTPSFDGVYYLRVIIYFPQAICEQNQRLF